MKGNASIGVYELVLSAVMIAATFTTVFARSRLTAIIGLGVIGYTLALFFVIFRAPDLALTRLIIETISVALFLLCFYHLPKLRFKPKSARFRVTNALVSVGVGTVVTPPHFQQTASARLKALHRILLKTAINSQAATISST